QPKQTKTIHGSAVAIENRGALIIGRSGSGKSSLALELISRGAVLVSDDQVAVQSLPEQGVILSAPARIEGLIEARGVGLIKLPHTKARLEIVVNLDEIETERLPEPHTYVIEGVAFPCVNKVENDVFVAMLVACLKGTRINP
ncbi:MAG: HPr kinase/phosphatase C-terminal domain-containing protein, partial [Boseongicola sp.]|nr:HPr kinase/phosphatase C-terminal domain-containing protein [Boseongicola sp.]